MFRKIVSNLAFSPALVGQLGFYARRLKKEETTRRAGLVFTALALVVQSLTVFTPPEAANASSPADFISGGVSSKTEFLKHYDDNTNRIKGLFSSLGIKREDVVNTSVQTINKSDKYVWSRTALYSHAQGERPYTFNNGSGDVTFWYRPMENLTSGPFEYQALVGHSDQQGWFAIKMNCGNLITKTPPKDPKPEPVVVCNVLRVSLIKKGTYRATVKANKSGPAQINGYEFNIEGSKDETVKTHENTAQIDFQKDKPGKYTIKAVVLSSIGRVSSPDCRDTITIKDEKAPLEPSALCVSLTADVKDRTTVTLNGAGQTENGATINKYVFVVTNNNGDIIKKIVKETNKLTESTGPFQLVVPGEYNAILTLNTSVGDRSGAECRTSLTILPPAPTPPPTPPTPPPTPPTPPPTPPTPPAQAYAECSSLKSVVVNRTLVSLTGTSVAGNGATVSEYVFVVNNKNGREIERQVVKTPALKATANSFTLDNAGEYTAVLTVTTSVGKKTSDNCIAKFTIVPPNVCAYNPSLKENDPDCQPCPTNPDLWIKDEDCTAKLVNTKTATNMTQGNVNASTVTAMEGDRISYTLTVENMGVTTERVTVSENLSDVLEYATLTHTGAGTFDSTTKVLSWGEEEVGPGKKITHTIVIQVLDTMPAMNTGVSQSSSYDCIATNTFGNTLNIAMNCPAQKLIIEQIVSELPSTGPTENMLFAGVVGAVVVYFYSRSRQLSYEVKLIRKDFNMGTI